VTPVEEFEQLRPLLFSIAYRILGSVAEAEDAVQDSWLRFDATRAAGTTIASPKAFLSAVVTRISIDVLRSARVQRERYVGQWLPEPLLTDPYQDPARVTELADSLSMAALLLLERLSPLERAVFVLREVFGFEFAEIATTVDRSEAACRQLAARARRHMDAGRPRFDTDRNEREALASRFFDALRGGDVEGLRELLAADVQMTWDTGGTVAQAPGGFVGVKRVVGMLALTIPELLRLGVGFEPHDVNGHPGAVVRDGGSRVLGTMTLEILGGRVQTIRSVVNPDKLGHLGPVANSSPLLRAAHAARHSS
jgi:RNA polymerase sigma-70 factor (ECF subfamily)